MAVLVLLSGILSAVGLSPAQAAVRPAASPAPYVDPGGDERVTDAQANWYVWTGIDAATALSKLNNADARPIDVEIDNNNPANPTYTVTAVENSGNYAASWDWHELSSDTVADGVAALTQYATAHQERPISVQVYPDNGQWWFEAVLVGNPGNLGWELTSGDLGGVMNSATSNSLRITRLQQYSPGQYLALMIANSGATASGWWVYSEISAADVTNNEKVDNAQVLDLQRNADGTYTVVLIPAVGTWTVWFDRPPDTRWAGNMDLRIVATRPYTDASGHSGWVYIVVENNPDHVAAFGEVFNHLTAALGQQADASEGVLQIQDSALGLSWDAASSGQYTDTSRIASISKTFLATTVLKLVGNGQLSLTDTVDHWLPGVVPNGYGANVTVQMLLNHTSGFPDYGIPVDLDNTQYTPTTLINDAFQNPINFPPGTNYHYTNTEYVLLAMMVEKVTGASYYGDVIKNDIITPLGLTNTTVPDDNSAPTITGWWRNPADNSLVNTTGMNISGLYGAGAIISNVVDVNKFFHALLTGQVLPAAQLAEMESNPVWTDGGDNGSGNYYGLGIVNTIGVRSLGTGTSDGNQESTLCGSPYWWHNGALAGYRSFSAHLPDGSTDITWMSGTSDTLAPNSNDYDMLFAAFCRFSNQTTTPLGLGEPSANATSSGAETISARAYLHGAESAGVQVNYGTSTNYTMGAVTTVTTDSTGVRGFAIPLSGLTPGTTYHYQVVLTGNDVKASSPDQAFTAQ